MLDCPNTCCILRRRRTAIFSRTSLLLLLHNLMTSAGLPDAASIEAASWVEPGNDRTVLIDASTAFRVDKDWVYGFPGA
jgi:hypothetical protein